MTSEGSDRWACRDLPVLCEVARRVDARGQADSGEIAEALGWARTAGG